MFETTVKPPPSCCFLCKMILQIDMKHLIQGFSSWYCWELVQWSNLKKHHCDLWTQNTQYWDWFLLEQKLWMQWYCVDINKRQHDYVGSFDRLNSYLHKSGEDQATCSASIQCPFNPFKSSYHLKISLLFGPKPQSQNLLYCWWLKSMRSPLEVGSLSHYLQWFLHHPMWFSRRISEQYFKFTHPCFFSPQGSGSKMETLPHRLRCEKTNALAKLAPERTKNLGGTQQAWKHLQCHIGHIRETHDI